MDARGAGAICSNSDVPGTGARCSLPAAAMVVTGITGLVVAAAIASTGVIVGAAKDVVTVEVEATL